MRLHPSKRGKNGPCVLIWSAPRRKRKKARPNSSEKGERGRGPWLHKTRWKRKKGQQKSPSWATPRRLMRKEKKKGMLAFRVGGKKESSSVRYLDDQGGKKKGRNSTNPLPIATSKKIPPKKTKERGERSAILIPWGRRRKKKKKGAIKHTSPAETTQEKTQQRRDEEKKKEGGEKRPVCLTVAKRHLYLFLREGRERRVGIFRKILSLGEVLPFVSDFSGRFRCTYY